MVWHSRWFIDRSRIGIPSEFHDPNSGNRISGVGEFGIGHPWIKEDWVVADRLMGVLVRYLTFDSVSNQYVSAAPWSADFLTFGWQSPINIVLPPYGSDLQSRVTDYGITKTYEIEYDPSKWEKYYASNEGYTYPTSGEFLELLSKVDGAGNPFWTEFMKSGIPAATLTNYLVSNQQNLNISGIPNVAGAINSNANMWFSDFSTKIAIPGPVTDDGLPNYDINIKSVFNHYSPLFEEEFAETGLNELAMPNYYMMYYAPNNPSDQTAIPDVYRRQITLGNRFDWDHGPVDELTPTNYDAIISPLSPVQPDSDYYNRFLQTVLNLTPADVDAINSDMERYRDIAVRPRSVNWLTAASTRMETDWQGHAGSGTRREVKSKLPGYVEINFKSNAGAQQNVTWGNNLDTQYGKGSGTLLEDTILKRLYDLGLDNFVATAIINADSNWRDEIPAPPLIRDYAIQESFHDENGATDFRVYTDNELGSNATNPGYLKSTFNLVDVLNDLFQHGAPSPHLINNFGDFGNPSEQDWNLRHLNGPTGTWLIGEPYSEGPSSTGAGYEFENYADYPGQIGYRAAVAMLSSTHGVKNMILERTRTYSELMSRTGLKPHHQCYSETLVYKIEKRVVPEDMSAIPLEQLYLYTPLQVFYIANDGTQSFTYIDSQVIYGKKYQYDIKEMRLVIGNKYTYGAVNLTSEYVGTGAAVGNALGMYKPIGTPETPAPFKLANEPSVAPYYLNEGEDTNTYRWHRGHFIFKIDKRVAPYGDDIREWQWVSPEAIQIKLVPGAGVIGNHLGGALPVDAPEFVPVEHLSSADGPLCATQTVFLAWLKSWENEGWPEPTIPGGWRDYTRYRPGTETLTGLGGAHDMTDYLVDMAPAAATGLVSDAIMGGALYNYDADPRRKLLEMFIQIYREGGAPNPPGSYACPEFVWDAPAATGDVGNLYEHVERR